MSVGERSRVERVDQDAGLRRHELGRAADAGRDDRFARGHPFEQRLAERLDEGRLAEDGRLGDVAGHFVVRDAAGDLDVRPAFELRAKRAVADEDEPALVERRERIGEPDDVLPLDEAPDADENRSVRPCPASDAGRVPKSERSTPQSTTSVLPRASGIFASSSRRR